MGILEVTTLPQSSILYLYSIRDRIDLNPPYQREGDVWSIYKRQLLVDSLLNGFDIPKLYFHDLSSVRDEVSSIRPNMGPYRYAVVDGKQRLKAIWGFLEDEFSLSDDFVLMSEPSINLRGCTYSDISKKHPQLKIRLDATSLSVMRIETNEIELVDEMFSRLNEAVPLSSAEKRRTTGGVAVARITELSEHRFFNEIVSFKNHRARYFDIATKLLFLETVRSLADTKREYLDRFVRQVKSNSLWVEEITKAAERVGAVLDEMAAEFQVQDKLLRQVGIVPVYYWYFRSCMLADDRQSFSRERLVRFEEKRERVRSKIFEQGEINLHDAAIGQFNRLSQTPNDAYAIEFRVQVLVDQCANEERKENILAASNRYAFAEGHTATNS